MNRYCDKPNRWQATSSRSAAPQCISNMLASGCSPGSCQGGLATGGLQPRLLFLIPIASCGVWVHVSNLLWPLVGPASLKWSQVTTSVERSSDAILIAVPTCFHATNFCPQIVCPCLNFGVLASRFRRCMCFVYFCLSCQRLGNRVPLQVDARNTVLVPSLQSCQLHFAVHMHWPDFDFCWASHLGQCFSDPMIYCSCSKDQSLTHWP
jgi:hypothetical protein